MKIKKYQYNHIPFLAIVDNYDCPVCPYVSAYLSTFSSHPFNTQLRKACELLFVLRHFDKAKIDLIERIRTGELITNKEYLQFHLNSARNTHSSNGSLLFIRNISDKVLRNAIAANERQTHCVASETRQGRIRRFREYLEYVFNYFHDSYFINKDLLNRFNMLLASVKLDEASLGKNKNQFTSDPFQSTIPDLIFSQLLEMILPSSENNPFKGSKIRNYLIVSILIQSGIRRGALAKIKISDLHMHGNQDTISIYRSRIDDSDPRIDRPNQKTKAHLATIHPDLMVQIKYYIDHERSKIPHSEQHDYIFVTEKSSRGTLGNPISLKSINAIFSVLSKSLGFHVHPHLIRHKWNEVFDKIGTDKGVDPRLLEDIRKYAMGWSENTTMTRIYNENRLALKVREISKAHQMRIDRQ